MALIRWKTSVRLVVCFLLFYTWDGVSAAKQTKKHLRTEAITVIQGSSIRFPCKRSKLITAVRWSKRVGIRSYLPVNRRKVQTSDGRAILVLKNVALGDQGIYKCEGLKGKGWKPVKTVKLKVKPRHTFQFQPSPWIYAAHLLAPFVINCSTNDVSATTTLYFRRRPSRQWTQLTPSPNKLLQIGQVFTFVRFGLQDAGHYQCRARNIDGKSIAWNNRKGFVFVRPNIIPKVEIDIRYVILTAGSSTNITCAGPLHTNLEWLKKNRQGAQKAVPASQTASVTDNRKQKLVLMIRNAKLEDMSVYKCLLKTYNGRQYYKLASLSVHQSPELNVREPRPGVLTCKVRGFPTPTITWQKDGQQITCSSRASACSIKTQKRGVGIRSRIKLFIKRQKYAAANYTCVATNKLGTAQAHIQYRPKAKRPGI